MKVQHEQEWLSPSELGEMLGLGKTRVYSLIREELPVCRIGRIIRVNRKDIEAWLRANKVSPKD